VRTTPLPNTEIEPPATLPQEGYCCQPDTHKKARHCRASAVNWLEAIDQGSATVCGHWGQVLNRASRSTMQDLTPDPQRIRKAEITVPRWLTPVKMGFRPFTVRSNARGKT